MSASPSKKRKPNPPQLEKNNDNVAVRRRISSVTGDEVQHILRSLTSVQQRLKLHLGTLPLLDLSPPRVGGQPRKHIAQHTSLIRHLQRFHLINPKLTSSDQANKTALLPTTVFVEFGAGVGRFSDQLQEETKGEYYHLMIDRETFKTTRLRDATMRRRSSPFDSVRRVTADIKNVNLTELLTTSFLKEKKTSSSKDDDEEEDDMSTSTSTTGNVDLSKAPVIAVSKHLCGEAFDMALNCLYEYYVEGVTRRPVVCMTPCCHCLCTW